MGSALVHGIYAADSRTLSTRATFPSLLAAEERGGGSVARGFLMSVLLRSPVDVSESSSSGAAYEMGDLVRRMKGVSVYSFVDGLQTIPRAIEEALRALPNVTIKAGSSNEVKEIKPAVDDIEVCIYRWLCMQKHA
jgi:oxygen-dependent protoporphyrinogen oxidase